MADLVAIEDRTAVRQEHALLRECRLAQAERDAAREALARATADQTPLRPVSTVAWIVGGVLLGIAMVMSFAWNMGIQVLALIEAHAQRQHETTLAALDAAKVSSSNNGGLDPVSAGILGAALFLVSVWIVVRLVKRGG